MTHRLNGGAKGSIKTPILIKFNDIITTIGLILIIFTRLQVPDIIYYKPDTSVKEVRRVVDSVDIGYPDNVIVDYYDADGEWFERYFGCC